MLFVVYNVYQVLDISLDTSCSNLQVSSIFNIAPALFSISFIIIELRQTRVVYWESLDHRQPGVVRKWNWKQITFDFHFFNIRKNYLWKIMLSRILSLRNGFISPKNTPKALENFPKYRVDDQHITFPPWMVHYVETSNPERNRTIEECSQTSDLTTSQISRN